MNETIRLSASASVIEAAFQLLNSDPSASLGEIAALAGVGRATLHRHFAGRDELVRRMALQALREVDESAERAAKGSSSYGEALQRIFHAIVPLGSRHGFLALEPIQRFPDVTTALQRHREELLSLLEEVKKEGALSSEVSTDWMALVFDNLIHAGWEMVRRGQATQKQAAELAWRTFIAGVGPAR